MNYAAFVSEDLGEARTSGPIRGRTGTRFAARTGIRGLVAAVAHDGALPLAGLASSADLLAGEWAGLPEEARHDLAARIDAEAGRLIGRYRHLVLLLNLPTGTSENLGSGDHGVGSTTRRRSWK